MNEVIHHIETSKPVGSPALRDDSDREWAIERVRQHPRFQPAEEAFTFKGDPQAVEVLKAVAPFLPLAHWLPTPISVELNPSPSQVSKSWFGAQEGKDIFIYSPAYRNATTLIFTFFHEYGHLLHNCPRLIAHDAWRPFLAYCIKESCRCERDKTEVFADGFAWYLSNPSFYRLRYASGFDLLKRALEETR